VKMFSHSIQFINKFLNTVLSMRFAKTILQLTQRDVHSRQLRRVIRCGSTVIIKKVCEHCIKVLFDGPSILCIKIQ
jgi:hypothetical protein